MPDPTYIPLTVHSTFSILDSTLPVASLVDFAQQANLPAMALTDTNTVAGAVLFHKAAEAAGLRAITGSTLTVEGNRRLVLLAEGETGYSNICRLLSQQIDRDPPLVTLEELHRFRQGLVVLAGRPDQTLYEIYGRQLALRLSPHHAADALQMRKNLAEARRLRLPTVATIEAHYRQPEDRLLYDVTASMRTLTLLKQSHPEKYGPGRYYLHSQQEMAHLFREVPQALKNTLAIAERCQFRFALGDILFPAYVPPPQFAGQPPIAELRHLTLAGLQERYRPAQMPEAIARLDRELAVIADVGYAEYFLIFADIVRWCRQQGIATLARGSAAGSLVCYALGVSNVCPFRFGLMFERFLNKERMQFQKLADIDLDLPWDRRDEVIDYVFRRFGQGQVACIGALNTFQGRGAVADVAKVFGVPEREVRRFTERLPYFKSLGPEGVRLAIADSPECQNLPVHEEPWATVLSLANCFDNVPRHFTMHPCGLVIGATQLTDRLPLFRSAKGLLTTHYQMDDVEELGFLKMDLLGQAGLSVLRETLTNITEGQAARGEPLQPVSLDAVDEEDAATWTEIARGNMRGVFHIESPNMQGLLRMTDCRDIACLTALESVIRPGAANEGRKRAYARRHQGLEPPAYAHPDLEPLLRESYGLLIYEEHILVVANGFAGLPWGRADMLRRALVKNRDQKKIDQLGEEFRACALRRGRTPAEAEAVWQQLREFAGYMFNKAHSAAYAVEAYQGAWLKVRYPVELLASVLTNRRGFYQPLVYVLEAIRHGARFLSPDVRLADASRFTLQAEGVRLPLQQVKGLNHETIARIVAHRPFRDLGDFYRRTLPSHSDWVALLKCGALDGFGEARGRIFWRLCRLEASNHRGEGLFDPHQSAANQEEGPEDNLFSDAQQALRQQARWEQQILGFPLCLHPLAYFAPQTDWSAFLPAQQLLEHPQRYFGKRVPVAGLLVAERLHPTPRGPMKFLTLADYTGMHEVSLYADAYAQYGHLTLHPVVAAECFVEPYDNRKYAGLNGLNLTPCR